MTAAAHQEKASSCTSGLHDFAAPLGSPYEGRAHQPGCNGSGAVITAAAAIVSAGVGTIINTSVLEFALPFKHQLTRLIRQVHGFNCRSSFICQGEI
jgi:hypothetical protein